MKLMREGFGLIIGLVIQLGHLMKLKESKKDCFQRKDGQKYIIMSRT